MAQIVKIDDEVTPPKWEDFTAASIRTLRNCVDCYRNYVADSAGLNNPNDVVVATTISRETINQLLNESGSDAIRIYLTKEIQTNEPSDVTFLIVPAKETSTGSNKYEDAITDNSGIVLKMAACPSAVCPTEKRNNYLLSN